MEPPADHVEEPPADHVEEPPIIFLVSLGSEIDFN
jgi:hypothetical protein